MIEGSSLCFTHSVSDTQLSSPHELRTPRTHENPSSPTPHPLHPIFKIVGKVFYAEGAKRLAES